MSETLIKVEGVSKKFCRSLKRSLWYGIRDIGAELLASTDSDRGLRKSEFWALTNVDLELARGDTLGLIGHNGAGKTTLLRMLSGLIKPDSGRIVVRGRMQALIALGAGFSPILTARENIYVNGSVLGIPKKEIDRRFDEIVQFAGMEEFIDAPIQNYSSGMTVRLGFAVASHLDPDILLVDEVLAVGDEGFQRKCLNRIGELKQKGTGIILVSHNMHTISTFANKIAFLNSGRHQLFHDISEGIQAYRNLFISCRDMDIQKVCSGNDRIIFYNIKILQQVLSPGDSFVISMQYESNLEYRDVEVDLVIYSSNETSLHFQATNKAYQKDIDLQIGTHQLDIEIKNIRINNATGIICVSIWSNRRQELLFWWRIPVQFDGVGYSTGNSFLDVVYAHKAIEANK